MKQCFHEETVLFYVHCWQESSTHRLSIVVVGYTGRGKKNLISEELQTVIGF